MFDNCVNLQKSKAHFYKYKNIYLNSDTSTIIQFKAIEIQLFQKWTTKTGKTRLISLLTFDEKCRSHPN